MKQSNLLSILILFSTFFGAQCVMAHERTANIVNEKSAPYYAIFNLDEKIDICDGNLDVTLGYPCNRVDYKVKCNGASVSNKIKLDVSKNNGSSWENIKEHGDISNSNYNKNYYATFTTDVNILAFVKSKGTAIDMNVTNVKFTIAPHTILNTKSLSFNTALTDPDGETKTIDFYSCLTGSSGMTISIVNINAKDADGNNIDITKQISLSKTSIGANSLEKINESQNNFSITFTPTTIFTNATCSIKITNHGVGDPIYIPVTLSSSLDNPANFKCTKSGYSYVKLQWDAVSGAESYNLYDNGTLIGKNLKTTTYEIGNLKPGSTHNYTIKSYYNGSESAGAGIKVTLTSFPVLSSVTIPGGNVTQNSLIVNWSKGVSVIDDQPITGYHIHLYQHDYNNQNTTYYKGYYILKGADITTYTLDKLIDNTTYTIYVGPEFYDPIAQKTIIPTDGSDWRSATTTTKSFLPEEEHNGVIEYRGVWYRVHLNKKIDIANGEKDLKPHTINLDYPCETFRYEAWISGNAGAEHRVIVNDNNNNEIDSKKLNYSIAEGGYLENNKYIFGPSPISTNISSLKFNPKIGGTGAKTIYIKNMGAKIAPHIKFNTTITTLYNFGEVELDQTPSYAIDFKSFLVSPQGKLVVESNNPAFKINGMSESKVLAEGNTLEKTNDNNYNFDISFVGNDLGSTSATITIKDVISDKNGNDSVIVNQETIKVNGTRIRKTPTITWIDSKIIKVGESVENAASSNCGTEITYTSDSLSVIKVEGNKLIALSEGTANITATTKGNNIYKPYTSTVAFTTTNKKIQIIDWNQNFYLLTLQSSDMELTAKSLDRETNEETGNPIKYSSSNTSVVTVNNGELQVVGIGQTSIIAHQEGTSEYAPALMRKYVVVRNAVDGDCSNEFALYKPEPTEKGDESILPDGGGWDWSPIEVEYDLSTVGDKLFFSTSCSGASTDREIIVTDQDGKIVYQSTSFGDATNIPLERSVRKLKFSVATNLKRSISNIYVTPAIYLEADKNKITFNTPTQIANTTTLDNIITVDWANQPDVIWASITNVKLNGENIAESDMTQTPVFVITKNALIGGLCGNFGTTPLSVAFTPMRSGKYTANLIVGVGKNTEAKILIDIEAEAIAAQQSLIWEDFELTTADKNITITDVLCQSTKYNLLNKLGETITYTSSNSNVVEINNNNTLTVHKYGEAVTITATQDGKEGYINPATATKTLRPSIGTIRFDNNGGNGDNNWNTTTNWLPINTLNTQRNVLPSAVVNAEIAANATISNTGTINQINNITFDGGSLTIAATSALKANKITNENAENLILKASDKGNATLIYADGTPSATVEMYSKAKYGTKDTDGHHPEWQYMGVAVKGAKVGDFKYDDSRNAWLLKWEEKDNVTGDPWSDAPLAAGTALEAWAGYSITQPDTTTYTMSGQLTNGDHTYTLTRTIKEGAEKQDPDCGFNLLANSYTAPIDITKLKIDSFKNAYACIVLYNTGTYAQWESQQGKSGQNPGQLTVIPVEAAKAISEEQGLPTTIPSMQAFFVMAKEGGGTFTVDYETAVLGATNTGNQMRAPEAHDEFNVLKIMITGEQTRDQLFLLENENTSKAYDNGYEARKIFDAPRGHQMYATCEYGYASIDCSKSFIGQAIGLKGDNEGEKLTISFGIDKIKDYESLFLYDKATGEYVNIMAEEEYTFYGIRGADDNRFTIVTNPDDRNQTPPFVVIGNELAFDKSQIGTDNANIYIYDTLGRLLMTDKVNPGENYRIPDMPEGIYLVSMNGYTTKIVRK